MEVPNEQRGRCSGGHGMPSQPRYTTFQERKLQLQCLLPGGSLPKSCPHKYMSPRLARCEPYLAQVSFSPAQVAQLPMHPSLLHHSPRHHKAARSHQAYCLTDPDIASAQHTANRSCVGSQLHRVNKCRCSTLAPRSAPEAPCTSRRRCRGQNRQARSKRL